MKRFRICKNPKTGCFYVEIQVDSNTDQWIRIENDNRSLINSRIEYKNVEEAKLAARAHYNKVYKATEPEIVTTFTMGPVSEIEPEISKAMMSAIDSKIKDSYDSGIRWVLEHCNLSEGDRDKALSEMHNPSYD